MGSIRNIEINTDWMGGWVGGLSWVELGTWLVVDSQKFLDGSKLSKRFLKLDYSTSSDFSMLAIKHL